MISVNLHVTNDVAAQLTYCNAQSNKRDKIIDNNLIILIIYHLGKSSNNKKICLKFLIVFFICLHQLKYVWFLLQKCWVVYIIK